MTNILHNIMTAVSESDKLAACLQLCDVMDIGDVILIDDSTLDNIESYVRQKCIKMSVVERERYLDNDILHTPENFMFSPAVRQRILNVCATINNAHKCIPVGLTSIDRGLCDIVKEFMGVMSESQRIRLLTMPLENKSVDVDNKMDDSVDVIYKTEYLDHCEMMESNSGKMEVGIYNQCRNMSVLESMAQEFLPSITDIVYPQQSILSGPEVMIKLEKLYGVVNRHNNDEDVSKNKENTTTALCKIRDSKGIIAESTLLNDKSSMKRTKESIDEPTKNKIMKFTKATDDIPLKDLVKLKELKRAKLCKKKGFRKGSDNRPLNNIDIFTHCLFSNKSPTPAYSTSDSFISDQRTNSSLKEMSQKLGKPEQNKEVKKKFSTKNSDKISSKDTNSNKSLKSLNSLIDSIISSQHTEDVPTSTIYNQIDTQQKKKLKKKCSMNESEDTSSKNTRGLNDAAISISSSKIAQSNSKVLSQSINESSNSEIQYKRKSKKKSLIENSEDISSKERTLDADSGIFCQQMNKSLKPDFLLFGDLQDKIRSKKKKVIQQSDMTELRETNTETLNLNSKIEDTVSDSVTSCQPGEGTLRGEYIKPKEQFSKMKEKEKIFIKLIDNTHLTESNLEVDVETFEKSSNFKYQSCNPERSCKQTKESANVEKVNFTDRLKKMNIKKNGSKKNIDKTSLKESNLEIDVETSDKSLKDENSLTDSIMSFDRILESPKVELLKLSESTDKIQTKKKTFKEKIDKILSENNTLGVDVDTSEKFLKEVNSINSPIISCDQSHESSEVEHLRPGNHQGEMNLKKDTSIEKDDKTSVKETTSEIDVEILDKSSKHDHISRDATQSCQRTDRSPKLELIKLRDLQDNVTSQMKGFIKMSDGTLNVDVGTSEKTSKSEYAANDPTLSYDRIIESTKVELFNSVENLEKSKTKKKSSIKNTNNISSDDNTLEVEVETSDNSLKDENSLTDPIMRYDRIFESPKVELFKLSESTDKIQSKKKGFIKNVDNISLDECTEESMVNTSDKVTESESQPCDTVMITLGNNKEEISPKKNTLKKKDDKMFAKEIASKVHVELSDECSKHEDTSCDVMKSRQHSDESPNEVIVDVEEREIRRRSKRRRPINECDNGHSIYSDLNISTKSSGMSSKVTDTHSQELLECPKSKGRPKKDVDVSKKIKLECTTDNIESYYERIAELCKTNFVKANYAPIKHYTLLFPEEGKTAKRHFAYLVCDICKKEQRNNHQIKFNISAAGSLLTYNIIQHLKVHFCQKK